MKLENSMYYKKNFFKHFKPLRRTWLTVKLAKELLAKNHPDNRTPAPRRLQSLIDDIEGGLYNQYVGNPLKVDRKGIMIDGQYRCLAVIATGIPIPVAIEEGFEPEVFALLDNLGKARTFTESLAMDKFDNPGVLKPALDEADAFRSGFKQLDGNGNLKSDKERKRSDSYIDNERQKKTPTSCRELALTELGISECVDIICTDPKDDTGPLGRKARLQRLVPLGVLAGFYYTYCHIDKDLADTLVKGLSEGFTNAKRPFNVLKMYLADLDVRRQKDIELIKNKKLVKFMRIYAMNVAFNAEKKGMKTLNSKALILKIPTTKGASIKDVFLEVFDIVGYEKYLKWLKANVKGF